MNSGAIISEDGKYRFQLWRIWDESKPLVLWVMHNPSTADANKDDPTIRRCMGFTKSWTGYGGFYVGNLFPYRATNPKELLGKSIEEIAPLDSIKHSLEMMKKCDLKIFAYGNPIIKDFIPQFWDGTFNYLKLTKAGNPAHPLYLKKELTPQIFFPAK